MALRGGLRIIGGVTRPRGHGTRFDTAPLPVRVKLWLSLIEVKR